MTFLVGTIAVGESARDMYSGFPVDLFVLLTGVTYLFAIATSNGTVERTVQAAARLVDGRRRSSPGSSSSWRRCRRWPARWDRRASRSWRRWRCGSHARYGLDRRMVGLMVVHGAAAGNFSPLNVLSGVVTQALARGGLETPAGTLFLGNLAYNVALAVVITLVFRGDGRAAAAATESHPAGEGIPRQDALPPRLRLDQVCTLLALVGVATAALVFGLNIGFVALTAGAVLHLCFPASSAGAEKQIAWSVVLLVCGIVTYVAALQRYGTVDAVGALASRPWLRPRDGAAHVRRRRGDVRVRVERRHPRRAHPAGGAPDGARRIGTTGLVVALAISATVVDSTPFSTVGALVVANTEDDERGYVYRGLLAWGAVMVITAPFVTWLLFILPTAIFAD